MVRHGAMIEVAMSLTKAGDSYRGPAALIDAPTSIRAFFTASSRSELLYSPLAAGGLKVSQVNKNFK